MSEDEAELAVREDRPIRYMDRTRAWYGALGFPPYRWASHRDAPFRALAKPLAASRIALVTTAAPYRPEKGDQGPGAPYNGAAKFFDVYSVPIRSDRDAPSASDPDLRISHIAYDRAHTRAEDPATWLPLSALRNAVAAGTIVGIGPRIHGLPTNRSHRVTTGTDAVELLGRLVEDGVDAALFVPNCPVCHQSVTLAARHVEAAGIPTVVMGCAKDIVEQAGAPRFLFSDFPLGNSAGRPHDPMSQALTLDLALRLLAQAPGPRTTLHSPLRWSEDPGWKRDYSNPGLLSAEDLARRREEFDREKQAAKAG